MLSRNAGRNILGSLGQLSGGKLPFPTMRRTVIVSIAAFGLLCSTAIGQTTEGQASARLVGRPLLLIGLWSEDNLAFDSRGSLKSSSGVVPFTEAGIDVTSVKLKAGRLQIAGHRMGLEIAPDYVMRRVPAKTKDYKGNMQIEVEAGTEGDFKQALDAIFTEDPRSLTPSLPVYWQDFAIKHFAQIVLASGGADTRRSTPLPQLDVLAPGTDLPPARGVESKNQTTMTVGVNDEIPVHVNGSMDGPKLLNNVQPTFTELARARRYSGDVELYLWVEKDGSVSHVKIVKAVGLGLDEAAIAAVKKYRFSPAFQNGSPVTVDIEIDVNFQIF